MPIRIAVGQRVFAPSWLMTGLTLVLCALFVRLGVWQWGRYESKSELWAQFERGADQQVALGARATDELPRYARVEVEGHWLPQRQFLLDNRTHDGRAGYEVLTPFRRLDGRVLVVDRGWVPFTGYREQLPDVASEFAGLDPTAALRIVGRLDELPSAGLAVGRAAPALEGKWPRVTSYPTMAQLAASLAADGLGIAATGVAGAGSDDDAVARQRRLAQPLPLEPRILLLDAREPRGYVRAWQPGGRGPEQNWSYAIQWWSFAVVLVVLYVSLNLRKTQRSESRKEPTT